MEIIPFYTKHTDFQLNTFFLFVPKTKKLQLFIEIL